MAVSNKFRARQKAGLVTVVADEIETLGARLRAEGLASRLTGSSSKWTCVVKPEACKSLTEFFASDFGADFVKRLRAHGINPKGNPPKRAVRQASLFEFGADSTAQDSAAADAAPSPLDGKTIVITGTFTNGVTRPQAEEMAREAGANVVDSVSKKTHYLVAGDNPGASKTNKAAALGTKILDEAAFFAMLPKQ